MVKNKFFNELEEIYQGGRNKEALIASLGRARAKKECLKAIWKMASWK
jgi:enoyl-[acyl-carrier protein] reductase II